MLESEINDIIVIALVAILYATGFVFGYGSALHEGEVEKELEERGECD